jgi:transcriptional regulator with XRE-family HTH domain
MQNVLDNGVPARPRMTVALRAARLVSGLDEREVAERMGWQEQKLMRIESGRDAIGNADLHRLLGLYGVTDGAEVDRLSRLARDTAYQSYGAYRDVLVPEFLSAVEQEVYACAIRSYESAVIPGLLQIEEYAVAVSRTFDRGRNSEDALYRAIEARMRRQEAVDGAGSPRLHFILDEPVLRRWVGQETFGTGPAVMRRQLERLKELNRRPNVDIQVLPLTVGAHFGLADPFLMLEFPDPHESDLLFVESVRGDYVTRENLEEVTRYKEVFLELEKLAAGGDELDGIIDAILASWPVG